MFTVDSYQKNADGTLVSDSYGTNYPDVVTFELIPEALNDGYVPLQVFVPIMDAISSGTGTQPVFLKLDWSSLKATTSDDPAFDKNDNNNSNNNNSNGNNNNGSSIGNGHLEIIPSETILLEAANLVLPHLEVVLQV